MYLFILAMVVAILSGWSAYAHEEHRKLYLAICLTVSIAALALFLKLVPLAAWNVLSPYLWGVLLVVGFWALRTQVRRVLE